MPFYMPFYRDFRHTAVLGSSWVVAPLLKIFFKKVYPNVPAEVGSGGLERFCSRLPSDRQPTDLRGRALGRPRPDRRTHGHRRGCGSRAKEGQVQDSCVTARGPRLLDRSSTGMTSSLFKKFSIDEDVSTQSKIKSSATRAILRQVEEQYPMFTGEMEAILPKKAMTLAKWCPPLPAPPATPPPPAACCCCARTRGVDWRSDRARGRRAAKTM